MIILVAYFLLSFVCAQAAREEIKCSSNTEGLNFDVWCLRNQTEESSTCSSDSLTITWGYGDLNKGEVQFNILGHMCSLRNYKLSLYTFDKKSSDIYNHTIKELLLTRNKNPLLRFKNFHSSLWVSEANLNASSSAGRKLPFCNQIRNATFTYIYTGCYIMVVDVIVRKVYFSEPICFTTNFQQKSLYKQNVSVVSQYLMDRASLIHRVSNFNRLQVSKLHVQVWKSNSSITHCNHSKEKITDLTIVLKSSSINCFSRTTEAICKLEGNDTIECSTDNVTDGYYCFIVSLLHSPCLHTNMTVWDESKTYCHFSGEVENGNFIKKNEPQYSLPPFTSEFTIVTAVVVLLVLVVIVVLIISLYRKWYKKIKRTAEQMKARSPNIFHVDIKISSAVPQIYLLYSRDCKPFMDAMKIFRSLLKETLKCEVHDSFDPCCFEDMARIGVNWSGKLIANENVKVVLVESKCAKLHLRAHLETYKIEYKNPTSWDDFFMYSLKVLMHPKYNSYDKLFITRIPGFTSEEDTLNEITPYTRYDIPDAVDLLLSNISQQFNLPVPDCKHNIHELQEAIKNLQNYVKDDGKYLQELLIKREIHGFQKLISRFK